MEEKIKKKLINWAMLIGILLTMVFGFRLLQNKLNEAKSSLEAPVESTE